MAEGAGEVLRPGGGGRMAGAEPEVDGAGAGPQGKAETAKYTKTEQKETRTSTPTADAGEGQGQRRVGMPCGDGADRRPVTHPPFRAVERGEGGGAARQPRRSQAEVRSRIGL